MLSPWVTREQMKKECVQAETSNLSQKPPDEVRKLAVVVVVVVVVILVKDLNSRLRKYNR